MEINWYGLSCFRLQERNMATIVTDPFNASVGLPMLDVAADVVTVSHDSPGHGEFSTVRNYRHVLIGPGEFDIGNVFITGISTTTTKASSTNVLFVFDYDDIIVTHLGDITEVPTQTEMEVLERVNVLLLPVGGGNSLNAAQAAELVSMLEPNIVIPMHYKIDGINLELDGVERFLNEMGVTEPHEETSLRLSSGSLADETAVVILRPTVE